MLLDTNAVIAVFANDAGAVARINSVAECYLPVIAAGELLYGAERSAKVVENVRRVREFCESATLLTCDLETASNYGRIKNLLRSKGQPIPENDIWIAAIAVQYQLQLLSQDEHFDHVDGLDRLSW
jgi:tRNA(fMet)-specific endonuclease VapC